MLVLKTLGNNFLNDYKVISDELLSMPKYAFTPELH